MENEKYLKQIIKDFDKEVKALKASKSTNEVTEHQRALRPILTEMQLAVPRLGEDIHKLARETRQKLAEE